MRRHQPYKHLQPAGAAIYATPAEPCLIILGLLFAAILSTGLCVAAILAPAPTAIAPLVAAVCVGGPMFAGWQVPGAVASLRAERKHGRALGSLRRSLERLPEVEHPLGF
jgi:hypothetical protein